MLIFVFGEDRFNAKEKVQVMREAFLDKFDPSGANVVEFPLRDQKKFDFGQVAQAIQSPPFLAQKRMVILKGLMSEVTRKPESKPWIELLEKIPESTIVVMLDDLSVAKARKHAMVSSLTEQADVHEYIFEPLSESQALKWVADESMKKNLDMSPAISRQFVSMAGVDARVLSLELEKLAAYCKGRSVVQAELDLLVSSSTEDQLFVFLDALSARDEGKIKKLLSQQRLFGTADAQLFGMLVRQVRLLLAACDYFESNPESDKRGLASALGVHPFVAQKLTSQQSRFSKDELIAIQEGMLDGDFYVKIGILKPEQAVDLSIVSLTASDY